MKRNSLIILILLCLASEAYCATFRYRIGNLSGLKTTDGKNISPTAVSSALNRAIGNVESLGANINFKRGSNQDVTFLVGKHKANGRGVFDGRRIWLNSRGGWTGKEDQMRVILEHEIGHFLGLNHHYGDPRSIMSIELNSKAVWRKRHVDWLKSRYGVRKNSPTPEKSKDKPASVALAKEMQELGKRLQKDKQYLRQQEVTIRAVLVRLKQLQRDYKLKK